jgi:hypothetical protein
LNRALFWYKQELLGGLQSRGRLVIKWTCSNGRMGFLGFREFDLNERFISIIKSDSVTVQGSIAEGDHCNECSKYEKVVTNWTINNYSGIFTN